MAKAMECVLMKPPPPVMVPLLCTTPSPIAVSLDRNLPTIQAPTSYTPFPPVFTPAHESTNISDTNDTQSIIDATMNDLVSMQPLNDVHQSLLLLKKNCEGPSSQECGFCRLLPEGVMELKADDEVVVMIPID